MVYVGAWAKSNTKNGHKRNSMRFLGAKICGINLGRCSALAWCDGAFLVLLLSPAVYECED